jgi:hypothetical protein
MKDERTSYPLRMPIELIREGRKEAQRRGLSFNKFIRACVTNELLRSGSVENLPLQGYYTSSPAATVIEVKSELAKRA